MKVINFQEENQEYHLKNNSQALKLPSHLAQMSPNTGISLNTIVTDSKISQVSTVEAPFFT